MSIDKTLIQALENPSLYPHPVSGFKVMETHISWVILTGPYAYKIKKPVNLGFQDYTTLEKRHHYCELEVQYNQPLAGKLYVKVLPITGTPTAPQLDGTGKVLDYAVQMKQFAQGTLFSEMAQAGTLKKTFMLPLAKQLGYFHRNQHPEHHGDYGSPQAVFAPIQDNYTVIKKLVTDPTQLAMLSECEAWAKDSFEKLSDRIAQRKEKGFVKACHGDLHCGNIALFENNPLVFDCIEFNEHFRKTDITSDIGFLTMDLLYRRLPEHCGLFLNHYCDVLFDYTGLPLLKFYQHYRAMVRAKIALLTAAQLGAKTKELEDCHTSFAQHLALGCALLQSPKPTLTITVGAAGSGKSLFTASQLIDSHTIRLRSDVFRKHAFELDPHDASHEVVRQQLYHPDTTKMIYDNLRDTAEQLLGSGFSVIIDATCLKKWQRDIFFNLAKKQSIPFKIWHFDLTEAQMMENIAHRQLRGDLTSDATVEILKTQLKEQEVLSDSEQHVAEKISQAMLQQLMNTD